MEKVIPVAKPRALTPLEVIRHFKTRFPEYHHETISYAGRLDPMAEGLLLLLVGEANKKRQMFEDLQKTYEFSFLLGIKTDSYDVLGRITAIIDPAPDSTSHLSDLLPTLVGTYDQSYPPFSSMHVKGKPLFYWAREGKLSDIDIPQKKITISELALREEAKIEKDTLVQRVVSDIKKVKGEFRQNEIIADWKEVGSTTIAHFPLISCIATVSSGTYIRSLVHEIGQKLGSGATTYSICRTRVGSYTLSEALEII